MFSKIIKMGLTLVIAITMLFPAMPVSREYAYADMAAAQNDNTSQTSQTYKTLSHTPAVTEEYDPQASRLVVEVAPDTDVKALAEAVGAELVRTGPLNYCTLQFEGLYSERNKEEGRQSVLSQAGVLGAEWSNTYKVDSSPKEIKSVAEDTTEDIDGQTANKITVSVSDPEYNLQWGLKKIRANMAWDEGATGKDVVIAVVDTGVDLNHPDLVDPTRGKNNLVQGYDAFTRSALPGAAQDDNGHGTSVAGVIAALNNSKGIIGIAYEAKIMPIKVMDKTGEGEDSIIADGIIWAVDNGAKIINMSIGSDDQNKVLDDALQYAVDKGCLLIAASGNVKGFVMQSYDVGRTDNDGKVAYPAANPNVLAVSAIDINDVITEFSLTGKEVELTAPGKRILTDYWAEDDVGCAYSTGTSIAAPFVSASAALLWSKYPNASANTIRQALLKSAYELGEEGRDNKYGYGRVDVYRAMQYLAPRTSYQHSGSLGWKGGIINSDVIDGKPKATLEIPSGTFDFKIDQWGNEGKLGIEVKNIPSPESLPDDIIEGSHDFELSWGEGLARRSLGLSIMMTHSPIDADNIHPEELPEPQSLQSDETTIGDLPSPGEEQVTIGNDIIEEETNRVVTDEVNQLNQEDTTQKDNNMYLGYIYRWSGSRWIRIGGGVPYALDNYVKVNIYEPGIYKIGYSFETAIERIAGNTRIETAIQIAKQAFPHGTDNVIIARDDTFPDALAGAPLAYKLNAPIFLTNRDILPDVVFQAVRDFAPARIYILGGEGAVSSEVESKLFSIAFVTRIAGENRYSTAAAIAEMLGTRGEAVLVNSDNFPDAIAAASHAAYLGKPILLTASNTLMSETEQVLRKFSVTDTEIIGGTGAVSDSLLSQLPNPKRIGGKDRFATSANVIQTNKPTGLTLYVATGLNFPDALTGGILAASQSSNILLLPAQGPSDPQVYTLQMLKGKRVIALGGEGVITPEALSKVRILLSESKM